MSTVKLVICNRHASRVTRKVAQARWREEIGPATLEAREALGFERYAQLHCVGSAHPLRQLLALSRTRPVASLVALTGPGWSQAPRQRSGGKPGPAERWTVLDELWWPSLEALLSAASTTAGRAALDRLAEMRGPLNMLTAAVVGRELIVDAPRPEQPHTARVCFCLRPRADSTPEQTQAYWRNEHADLVRRLADRIGFDQYDQTRAVLDDPRVHMVVEALGGAQDRPYVGFANLSFPTIEAVARQFIRPSAQFANFKLMQDELAFVDPPSCPVLLGTRLPIA